MKSLAVVLMTSSALSIFSVFPISANAAGTHTHGSAEVSVAFEGAKSKIEFKSASDSVVGFEHAAKSATDKKRESEQLKKLENQFSEMVRFESALKCKMKKDKIENSAGADGHSDVMAQFNVECAKSPLASTIVFSFKKYFPALKDVDVQILVGTLQKSAEVTANGTQVELK